ncbi:MAG: hypothetical protein HQ582_22120, partial [Planctomycetes bacterium]|nr:hypothetical protein [Planctomycetota bacterium]
MSDNPTPSRQSAKRIGDLIKRSFLNYVDHWQEWIVPTVVAGAIAVVSFCCCWVPSIFVMGPVACGLYACALAALRNRPVHAGLLSRGWQRFGGSAAASIFISVVSALPVLVLFGLFMAFFAAIAAVAPSPPFDQRHMSRVESVDELATTTEETADEVHPPMEDALSDETDGALRSPQQVEEPPPLFVLLTLCAVLLFYALFFLAIVLAWVWQLWFTTRVMFVYPLLADRDIG